MAPKITVLTVPYQKGAASGKDVLEVTGSNVAAFGHGLIKDSKTYTDIYQKSVELEVDKTVKNVADQTK